MAVNEPGSAFPVILAVPRIAGSLAPREKTVYLSEYARKALALSAKRHQIRLGALEKTDKGAPIPFDGWHWSLSHKPTYVAGIVARFPVGIDLERIREVSPGMYQKIANSKEWALAGELDPLPLFFRLWTAKEAVLKAVGVGLTGLKGCCVQKIDKAAIQVAYQGKSWQVAQYRFDSHIAAVATQGPVDMEWERNYRHSD